MTIDEARRHRAQRLAGCQARASALGWRVVEDIRRGGFRLIGPDETQAGPVVGLPEIEQRLAELGAVPAGRVRPTRRELSDFQRP